MMQINVISRINEDKNFFFDLLYVARQLIDKNLKNFRILFIGDILSKTVYQDMLRLIGLFELTEYVNFTKKSIRFEDLPELVKNGFFFNFTIGNFMGYSGVESLNYGFKTIFYNTDRNLIDRTDKSFSMCSDVHNLFQLLCEIHNAPVLMEQQIRVDNLRLKNKFLLEDTERSFLRNALLGNDIISI